MAGNLQVLALHGKRELFFQKKKIHVAKAFGNWVKGDEGRSKCLMEKYTAEMLFNSLAKPTAPERDQTRYILRFDLKHIHTIDRQLSDYVLLVSLCIFL